MLTVIYVLFCSSGQANMGGNPKPWVDKIKSYVRQHSVEEKLGDEEHE